MIEYVLVLSAMAMVSAGLFRQLGHRTSMLVQQASSVIAGAANGRHGPSVQGGGGVNVNIADSSMKP